ncbi:extracellular solute-binding protein [Nereida sp. MMG025]|uniref:extracellular solute-binding protein n=1 Tax=Nereida sp. MMG025 TaxID=2909981 RepID=UPI001F21C14E|nr:extracellular solute-binding protein [Nereida sp. MMG025]MCF6444295.1 extracellular solute-binding protein [Nereida sp. MMG025]
MIHFSRSTQIQAQAQARAATRPFVQQLWLAASLIVVALVWTVSQAVAEDEKIITSYFYSTIGEPKYPEDFPHLSYVNPDAPKGGEYSVATVGTFNSMMPFSRKGDPAALASVMVERLMETALDDPNTDYGLLAEKIEYPESRDWVIFHLRPEARFSDGTPLTAYDAEFTWSLLMEQAFVSYREALNALVESAVALDERRIKYTFREGVPRDGLIPQMGSNAVFSKAWFEETGTRIDESGPTAVLGSGPYMVDKVDFGRSVSYIRNPDYWGKDLPINIGRHNFDRIRVEYFGDSNAAFEGFKAGSVTFRTETDSKIWATQYDFPALNDGRAVKKELPNGSLPRASGFAFNLTKPHLQDIRVREALGLMYNFTWTNETLQYGLFNQRSSFWQNTEMAATGVPTGKELEILQSVSDLIDPALLTDEVVMPHESSTRQLDRANLRRASALLDEAGWDVGDDGIRRKDGETLKLDILEGNPQMDRLILPYVENLKRLGVEATYNRVDPAQYTALTRELDYDMVFDDYITAYGPGLGYEQRFGSKDRLEGIFNPAAFGNEAADKILESLKFEGDAETFIGAARALDRLMRAERFIVPAWYNPSHWVAYYDYYEHPEELPTLALGVRDFWWSNEEKYEALRDAGAFQR